MLNDKFFDTYDYQSVIEQILKDYNIPSDDNHYGRHIQELRKKVEEIKKLLKSRDYFKEMPTLDKDFSSYVISNINIFILVGNTPFVEEEKRDKFQMFMNKTITKNFGDKIREYIFPYRNEDKEAMNNKGFIILKFDSFEEAKMAALAMYN